MLLVSKNDDAIYVYAKGLGGKFWYHIHNSNNYCIFASGYVEDMLTFLPKLSIYPTTNDKRAILSAMHHIADHLGKNSIPQDPVITVYSNVENNAWISDKKFKPKSESTIIFSSKLKEIEQKLMKNSYKNFRNKLCASGELV